MRFLFAPFPLTGVHETTDAVTNEAEVVFIIIRKVTSQKKIRIVMKWAGGQIQRELHVSPASRCSRVFNKQLALTE